jgi:DNA modification methylase
LQIKLSTFPQNLIKPWILAGCPTGGIVLDPFFGAGTTGLVAQQSGRNYIGINLNAEYGKIAEERLRENRKGW